MIYFFNLFPLLTQIEYLERMLVQDKCMKRGPRKLHCQWSEELIVCTCNLINSHLFATLLSFYQHVDCIYLFCFFLIPIFQQVYLLMARPAVARPIP